MDNKNHKAVITQKKIANSIGFLLLLSLFKKFATCLDICKKIVSQI